MDEDDEPATTSFRIFVDGFERTVNATSWFDATHLELDVEGAMPTVSTRFEYLVTDPLFNSEPSGIVAQGPQVVTEIL